MIQARAPCPNCDLPFYAERNTACPYCGSAVADTPGESAAGTKMGAGRSRVTCPDCGLPHYDDTEDGCPYCTAAESGDHAHRADAAAAEERGMTDTGSDTAESTGSRGDETAGTAEPRASAAPASTEADERASASQSRGGSGSGGILGFIRGLFGR